MCKLQTNLNPTQLVVKHLGEFWWYRGNHLKKTVQCNSVQFCSWRSQQQQRKNATARSSNTAHAHVSLQHASIIRSNPDERYILWECTAHLLANEDVGKTIIGHGRLIKTLSFFFLSFFLSFFLPFFYLLFNLFIFFLGGGRGGLLPYDLPPMDRSACWITVMYFPIALVGRSDDQKVNQWPELSEWQQWLLLRGKKSNI